MSGPETQGRDGVAEDLVGRSTMVAGHHDAREFRDPVDFLPP